MQKNPIAPFCSSRVVAFLFNYLVSEKQMGNKRRGAQNPSILSVCEDLSTVGNEAVWMLCAHLVCLLFLAAISMEPGRRGRLQCKRLKPLPLP
ncbi:MAG: hypothetical protein K2X94_05140 [Amoebophilaceae bacterium]|nr:hypothetical protein [Amoebophilaceae bacterium]